MLGLFHLDLMCKIGIQEIWKSAPPGLVTSAQLGFSCSPGVLGRVRIPSSVNTMGHCGETALWDKFPTVSLIPSPSPAFTIQHITSQHQIFMKPPTRDWLLQVAVTSVIAGDFPLQRKIVFIMCHAHTVKQVFGLSGFPRARGRWDFT